MFKFLLRAFPVEVVVLLLFVEGLVLFESLRRAKEVGDDAVVAAPCGDEENEPERTPPLGDDDKGDDDDDDRIPVAPAFRVGGGIMISSVE